MFIIKSAQRGKTKTDWLHALHSFSFGQYYDPQNTHFGALRVLNDDSIAPASGFPRHPHRDMEIITIVTEGAVYHKDSTGGEGTISTGDVQVMTAGSGILHSEANANTDQQLRLFQIWITPRKANLSPRYEQKFFGWDKAMPGKQQILVGPIEQSENNNWLGIHQDAIISTLRLTKDSQHNYNARIARNGTYVFTVSGSVEISMGDGQALKLNKRDAAGLTTQTFKLKTNNHPCQLLLIEVPLDDQKP